MRIIYDAGHGEQGIPDHTEFNTLLEYFGQGTATTTQHFDLNDIHITMTEDLVDVKRFHPLAVMAIPSNTWLRVFPPARGSNRRRL